ncbi:DsbA family protein [Vibrio cholerae]|nr:thioredoxin [Vibrio cholerae]
MNKQPIRQIEFFHDAVCGWCYVLSPRLRKLAKQQNIQIVQRCFVLQRSDEEMVERFGSLAQAKSEILNHWIAC